MNLDLIYNKLGVNAVLLPARRGTKRVTLKGWNKLTYTETQTSDHKRKLSRSTNIAVSLGAISENLCSIDFDDDAALEHFLSHNPTLSNTLRTSGSKGANL